MIRRDFVWVLLIYLFHGIEDCEIWTLLTYGLI